MCGTFQYHLLCCRAAGELLPGQLPGSSIPLHPAWRFAIVCAPHLGTPAACVVTFGCFWPCHSFSFSDNIFMVSGEAAVNGERRVYGC